MCLSRMPPKRPTRKAGAEATEKLATEKKASPAAKPAEAGAAVPETRAPSAGAKAGKAEAKKDAPLFEDPAKPPVAARGKKKDAAGMDEVSEERSGDQPVVDDDATTAPVPDRVGLVRDTHTRRSPTNPGRGNLTGGSRTSTDAFGECVVSHCLRSKERRV